mmetsp:Transcript_79990/g.152047  ORF Transcript_79990/g.152047 Transcript_79990/m.152047 type:complete len:463 (-) Transcript_79990:69-1457(-)
MSHGDRGTRGCSVGSAVVAVKTVSPVGPGYLDLSAGDILVVQYRGCEAHGDAGWLFGCSMATGRQGWFSEAAVTQQPGEHCCITGSSLPPAAELVGSEVEASANVPYIGRGYLELSAGTVVKVEYAGAQSTNDAGWLFGCSTATGHRGWFASTAVLLKLKRAASDQAPPCAAPPSAPAASSDKDDADRCTKASVTSSVATPSRSPSGSPSCARAAASAEQAGLRLLGARAPPELNWQYPLCDPERQCFVGFLPGALDQRQTKAVYRLVQNGMEPIGWDTPIIVMKGKVWVKNQRQTRWLVAPGCSCEYTYGGPGYGDGTYKPVTAKPIEFPSWMHEVMQIVMPLCGLADPKTWPNCCSMNRYSHNSDACCDWHADDEELFQGATQNCCIISLSLGQKRNFELRRVGETSVACKVGLNGGDLCTMEGMTQKHYQHAVHRHKEGRMNLTWRWIVRHEGYRCRRR